MSNTNGDWPSTTQSLARGATSMRTLMVFNDTFSGTAIDVTWEVRAGSAAGAVASQGTQTVQVPLGGSSQITIAAVMPATGNSAYLVLRSSKGGREIFVEDAQVFQLQ